MHVLPVSQSGKCRQYPECPYLSAIITTGDIKPAAFVGIGDKVSGRVWCRNWVRSADALPMAADCNLLPDTIFFALSGHRIPDKFTYVIYCSLALRDVLCKHLPAVEHSLPEFELDRNSCPACLIYKRCNI